MNPGDVKYSFTDKNGTPQTVVIPAEVFRQARRDKVSNAVAIARYLAEQGYKDMSEVEETSKAKQSKVRTRKPNNTKREIINLLVDTVNEAYDEYGKAEVTNPERQFRFEIDGKVYEVTLVQKRG
jgi:hypothetical protein